MLDLSIKNQIDPLLKKLASKKSLDVAEELISVILNLIGVKCEKRQLLNIPRIDAELPRFELAPGFARQAAAFKIPIDKINIFDTHFFYIKKITKTNLSWLVGVTPNFEDSEANELKNIGIDFVIPTSCDRIIILLSNRYKIRSLELKDKIYPTQNEVLSLWKNIKFDDSKEIKATRYLIHKQLWDSFNFEPINDKFYLELVEHFSLLVSHLEKKFGKKPSVMFTTRLIGRVLFIWFLKKKELINENIDYFVVNDPLNQISYYKNKLEVLIFEVLNKEISDRQNKDKKTPYLNGGLFEISQTDFCNSKELSFPENFFNQLYETLNKYNFTVDESSPDFQQVAVDPEMLGRIFESLLSEQIDDESGNNKKKLTGSFYTPREIVSYMCETTLVEFLKSKIPYTVDRDLRLQELIELPETIFRDQDQNKRRDWKPYAELIVNALSGSKDNEQLTVLDPAVGSGAFPMGMLQLLVKIYSRLDSKYEKNISKLKRDILSKSLYGVDIEPTAIEICRLRAWLSIIVDIPENNEVEPLPNLDFKFACTNTLVPLDSDTQTNLFEDQNLKNKLITIRTNYFSTSSKLKKQKLQNDYKDLTHETNIFESKRTGQLKSYRPFDVSACSDFYDPEIHHGVPLFDIIIGNPPYVSTKGISVKFKNELEIIYGFADDLYSHFYFRAINLLKHNGLLGFITSKTFWTIQTKKNVRELLFDNNILIIYDTSNPFSNVLIDTCVVFLKKNSKQIDPIIFLKTSGNYSRPTKKFISKSIYKASVNQVIFDPSPDNLKIYDKLNLTVSNLLNKWWTAINSSKNITKNLNTIKNYQKNLTPGQITLLGLITDGGQGLATANNGRFIGVHFGSKEAKKVTNSRIEKFCEIVLKNNLSEFGTNKNKILDYFNKISENQIRILFESFKEKYGRDIFGQGYIYKIISDSEIANIKDLTKEERLHGISGKKIYVPYDKGDKDGNRWIYNSPFYIDWSVEAVSFLRENSGKKGTGMPVLRNPQFYFKKGICWILTLNEQSEYQKARIKEPGVFDVNAMSLFPSISLINEKYIVCLLNSYLIFQIKKNFINSSSAFQINDARQLPIIIPTKVQLEEFEDLFDRAASIKSKEYSGMLSNTQTSEILRSLQIELDKKVLNIYDLSL
jgi:hypothetical protein